MDPLRLQFTYLHIYMINMYKHKYITSLYIYVCIYMQRERQIQRDRERKVIKVAPLKGRSTLKCCSVKCKLFDAGNTCTVNSKRVCSIIGEGSSLFKVLKKNKHATTFLRFARKLKSIVIPVADSKISMVVNKTCTALSKYSSFISTNSLFLPLFSFLETKVKSLPLENWMLQEQSTFQSGISSTNPRVEWDPAREIEQTDQLFNCD